VRGYTSDKNKAIETAKHLVIAEDNYHGDDNIVVSVTDADGEYDTVFTHGVVGMYTASYADISDFLKLNLTVSAFLEAFPYPIDSTLYKDVLTETISGEMIRKGMGQLFLASEIEDFFEVSLNIDTSSIVYAVVAMSELE